MSETSLAAHILEQEFLLSIFIEGLNNAFCLNQKDYINEIFKSPSFSNNISG